MRIKPEQSSVGSKPNWRERQRMRKTNKYQYIQQYLNTSDCETLLLMRLADMFIAELGRSLTGPGALRNYVIVGLGATVEMQTSSEDMAESTANRAARSEDSNDEPLTSGLTTLSSPWMIRDVTADDARIVVREGAPVLTIDRRHLHRLEPILVGRVEPVDPIVRAFHKMQGVEIDAPVAASAQASNRNVMRFRSIPSDSSDSDSSDLQNAGAVGSDG